MLTTKITKTRETCGPRCLYCKGPLPPADPKQGRNTFCASLCASRYFARIPLAKAQETIEQAKERFAQRKAKAKERGVCDWCGARAKGLYCSNNKACQNKRTHDDWAYLRTKRAMLRREAHALQPCSDCGNPINRVVYVGGLPTMCERCSAQRNKAWSGNARKKSLKDPNVPLPRALRRVLEAIQGGVQTRQELEASMGIGKDYANTLLSSLRERGLVAERQVGAKRILTEADRAVELDGALLAVAEAEQAYAAAWERVLATRKELDQRLLAPTPRPLPKLAPASRRWENSIPSRILAKLNESPAIWSIDDLAACLGCPKKTVRSLLSELHTRGYIERVKMGQYRGIPRDQVTMARAS